MSLDNELNVNVYKQECQIALEHKFISDWQLKINAESEHPILKTYNFLNRNRILTY